MEYEVEFTAEDIGEMIMMLRIRHFKMHVAPFAKEIGVTEKLLISTEDGKGPHGMMVLKKINDRFPDKVSMFITVDMKAY